MWLQAGITAAFVLSAQCCTDYLSKTASGKYKMSARNLDHGTSMDMRVRGIKAGSRVSLLQACPTCPPQFLKTKYDLVGITGAFDYDFGLVDGVNSEGLGLSGLQDHDVITAPEWDPSGPTTTIPYMFVGGYILAMFKNVAEVQAALTTSKVQFTRAYIGSKVFPDFPLELSIHDALGNSVVLGYAELNPFNTTQFGQPQPAPTPSPWGFIPNPQHVLTNSPSLPYQNAALAYFEENSKTSLLPQYVLPYLQYLFAEQGLYPAAVNAYFTVPGDNTAFSRRIRLYGIREAQGMGNWPNHSSWANRNVPMSAEPWSPNYGNNEWWQSFVTAANGILHVSQINGWSDQSLLLNPETNMNNPYDPKTTFTLDQTIISIIRDHTTRQYFWWSLRAQRWQGYDLKTMTQSFITCVTPLPVVTSTIYDRSPVLNNKATSGKDGVAVSASGGVAPSVCRNPLCPATLSMAKGIGIKCVCNGENSVNDVNGCAAPLTRDQVLAWADAMIQGHGRFPPPPVPTVGSLTIRVMDCKSLNAQECCDAFGSAVARGYTVLPRTAPVSCILPNGGTLAAYAGNKRD